MDEYYIPKQLDMPKKYLIFSIDEVIAIAILFFIFVFVMKQHILAIIVCGLAFHGLRKLKGEKSPHYLLHLAYWHLPFFKLKQIPPSYKRKFLG